jgi:hypothetical protein
VIELPDFSAESMYAAETSWHLQLSEERLGKLLAHWEVMKMTQNVPGAVVECGVFKGTSFLRFGIMRQMLGGEFAAKLVGFDMFGDTYPETLYEEDQAQRSHWIDTAGAASISVSQLGLCLERQGVGNYELIPGDAIETIPLFVEQNPALRIAVLNVDIDFFEATETVLQYLGPLVSSNGVILFDNYAGTGTSGLSLYGDTAPVDAYIKKCDLKLRRFNFASRPCYVQIP